MKLWFARSTILIFYDRTCEHEKAPTAIHGMWTALTNLMTPERTVLFRPFDEPVRPTLCCFP